MTLKKKYHLFSVIFVSAVVIAIYIAFEYSQLNLFGMSSIKPIFVGLIGILSSLVLLLLFDENVFVSWLKYIVWWYIPAATWLSSKPHDGLFYGRIELVTAFMSVLFLITLIHSLIMTIILKQSQ